MDHDFDTEYPSAERLAAWEEAVQAAQEASWCRWAGEVLGRAARAARDGWRAFRDGFREGMED